MTDTTIAIDRDLLREALDITRSEDARGLIEGALKDIVRGREAQRRLLELRGQIQWEGDLDEMRRDRHQPSDER